MLEVAGTYSPPFRPLTPEEDASIVEMINRAGADVLWVGLGCPKQECWMYEHREQLRGPRRARVTTDIMMGARKLVEIFAGVVDPPRAVIHLRLDGTRNDITVDKR